MNRPGSFLGGARDRLLPASIPFGFFMSAAVFHVAAWAVLFLSANQVAGFTGGLGPVLAAVHLATLGVFAMTAIGASYQLLPVVTRRPLARDWPARLSLWLLVPGICLLAWVMADIAMGALKTGAAMVCAGLAVFAMVTADNLRRAGGLLAIAAHGWAALVALVGLAGLGLGLIWDFEAGFLYDHAAVAAIHLVLASYGFMGLLVLGFSMVLVPMFAMSRSQPERAVWLQGVLAALALAGFTGGKAFGIESLVWFSLLAGSGAVLVHLWLMRAALASRMRKRLGLSFALIRASWVLLALSLVLGGLVQGDLASSEVKVLFGFMVLGGWLLTFLMGILQRIMPFLASMHAVDKSGLPPPLSSLTAERPLEIHAFCHFAALLFCSLGIAFDLGRLVQLGAALGTVGGLAFAAFLLNVIRRLRAAQLAV